MRFIDPTPGLLAEYRKAAEPLRIAMEQESSYLRRLRLRRKLARLHSRYLLARMAATWFRPASH